MKSIRPEMGNPQSREGRRTRRGAAADNGLTIRKQKPIKPAALTEKAKPFSDRLLGTKHAVKRGQTARKRKNLPPRHTDRKPRPADNGFLRPKPSGRITRARIFRKKEPLSKGEKDPAGKTDMLPSAEIKTQSLIQHRPMAPSPRWVAITGPK
jgi:hypothetical protein